MKTIIFGINDDSILSPGFSRIDLTNVIGQYLDTLEINGDNYLTMLKKFFSEILFHFRCKTIDFFISQQKFTLI